MRSLFSEAEFSPGTSIICACFIILAVFSTEFAHAHFWAEIGTEFTFNASFTHSLRHNVEVVWYLNDMTRSQCNIKKGCRENVKEKTLTTLKYVAERNIYECTLSIKNVSQSDEGLWTLHYLGNAGVAYPQSLYSSYLNISVKKTVQVVDTTSVSTKVSKKHTSWSQRSLTTNTFSTKLFENRIISTSIETTQILLSKKFICGCSFMKSYVDESKDDYHVYETIQGADNPSDTDDYYPETTFHMSSPEAQEIQT
ncbi:hypothetical protein Bpfe_003481 [Biomphalaria pfeifferi]|uniref:Uncharacterized protein n=1 Tax=Biomphalaria pfeifferi TaxID=112525 RepID=A0AAD8C5C8_BIOPF|nr:hypothetical protein Bpfe_003481 [Biomphalaria pfeifferi]